jgi:hypothetical protein
MASYEQTPLQVFGNYPATRGEVEASLKANPNVDPSRPFSVRDPLVPLSDFCEIKGVNGEHQLHGITTAEHNYKLVPAVDYTAGYPQESGQERHNVFAMDPNPPLDLSNLPTKWGKVTGIKCVRDITHYLQGATNIVVIAGAGVRLYSIHLICKTPKTDMLYRSQLAWGFPTSAPKKLASTRNYKVKWQSTA